MAAARYSDELAAHLPHARLARFDDAGHGLPIQHAAAVNRLLRDHMAAAESLQGPTPSTQAAASDRGL